MTGRQWQEAVAVERQGAEPSVVWLPPTEADGLAAMWRARGAGVQKKEWGYMVKARCDPAAMERA